VGRHLVACAGLENSESDGEGLRAFTAGVDGLGRHQGRRVQADEADRADAGATVTATATANALLLGVRHESLDRAHLPKSIWFVSWIVGWSGCCPSRCPSIRSIRLIRVKPSVLDACPDSKRRSGAAVPGASPAAPPRALLVLEPCVEKISAATDRASRISCSRSRGRGPVFLQIRRLARPLARRVPSVGSSGDQRQGRRAGLKRRRPLAGELIRRPACAA
jgi:hypothetical protein